MAANTAAPQPLNLPGKANLVLIGFMGTGKSTIAKTLRRYYQMEVAEMDDLLVSREGMSIPEIFAQKGEAYFRARETDLLKELQQKSHMIISCGGGAALRSENVTIMKENGLVILLDARPETILKRVGRDRNRPVLNGRRNLEGIRELMDERRPRYEAAADLIIHTDGKNRNQIVKELVEKLSVLSNS